MFELSVRASSPEALARDGPLVAAAFRPDPDVGRAGTRIPAVSVSMMLDTGAARSLVDDRVPRRLGIVPHGYEYVVGVTGAVEWRPVYPMVMELEFSDHAGRVYTTEYREDIIGMKPKAHDAHGCGLIGRDFLEGLELMYDGVAGRFALIDRHSAPPPEHARGGANVRAEAGGERHAELEARRAERHRHKSERKSRRTNPR
jgi:hypothetical protein